MRCGGCLLLQHDRADADQYISISQMRKPSLEEVTELTQGQAQRHGQDSKLGPPAAANFPEVGCLHSEQTQTSPSLLTPSIKANFKVSWFLNEQP